MFDRFDDTAKGCMSEARRCVERLGHDELKPEHILIGLMAASDRICAALERLGVEPELLRREVEARIEPGSGRAVTQLPLAPGTQVVLERCLEETLVLGGPSVTDEHLLLALLAEAKSEAAHALRDLGVSLDSARGAVLALRRERGEL